MKKRHYDLVFGLGQACGCSQTLRRAGLQLLSFPGDWTAPIYKSEEYPAFEHDLRERTERLCANALDELFVAEDLHLLRFISGTGKNAYANYRTRYIFNHDFRADADFETMLPEVVAKYRRRRDRLFELIAQAKKILAVRMDMPGGEYPTDPDDCRYARDLLRRRFTNAEFDMLLISHREGVAFDRRTFEEIEPGLFRLAFDFLDRTREMPFQPDLRLTGTAVAELFSVTDYRTDGEKHAYAEKERARKAARRAERSRQRLDRIGNLLRRLFGRTRNQADEKKL